MNQQVLMMIGFVARTIVMPAVEVVRIERHHRKLNRITKALSTYFGCMNDKWVVTDRLKEYFQQTSKLTDKEVAQLVYDYTHPKTFFTFDENVSEKDAKTIQETTEAQYDAMYKKIMEHENPDAPRHFATWNPIIMAMVAAGLPPIPEWQQHTMLFPYVLLGIPIEFEKPKNRLQKLIKQINQ